MGSSGLRKSLVVFLPSSHADLYHHRQTDDTAFMLFVKEVTKWQTEMTYHHGWFFMTETNWRNMNKKMMASVCHREGRNRAEGLMVQRLILRPLRNNTF